MKNPAPNKTPLKGPDLEKEHYIYYLENLLTKEMKPFIRDLIVPCDCGSISGVGRNAWKCSGWTLKTMLKKELPAAARNSLMIFPPHHKAR